MRQFKCYWVLFICLITTQLCSQTYNNIRVAYISANSVTPIPTRFYERAQANGYNYILAEFRIWEDPAWINGRYTGNSNSILRKRLRDEFLSADKNGLKLIPLFQTSSEHSWHWVQTKNPNIQWQTLPSDVIGWSEANRKVPAFAPDPSGVFGFDSSFNQLLNIIYDAFADARGATPSLKYSNIEYIHFGGDEPFFNFKDTRRVMVLAGLCQLDRDWLDRQGLRNSTPQNKIISLLGNNIRRKVQMINTVGNKRGHTTTALYYADMLDPNFFGGDSDLCTFTDIFNPSASATTNIKTSSLASNADVQTVRSQSILVQWNYEQDYLGGNYNTFSTFNHFKSNNLRFLHGSALADENNPILHKRLNQLMDQAVTCANPVFNKSALGYVSFHWCSGSNIFDNTKGRYDQRLSYMTMEFLSHILLHNAAIYD